MSENYKPKGCMQGASGSTTNIVLACTLLVPVIQAGEVLSTAILVVVRKLRRRDLQENDLRLNALQDCTQFCDIRAPRFLVYGTDLRNAVHSMFHVLPESDLLEVLF
jgi:hypothetical protein